MRRGRARPALATADRPSESTPPGRCCASSESPGPDSAAWFSACPSRRKEDRAWTIDSRQRAIFLNQDQGAIMDVNGELEEPTGSEPESTDPDEAQGFD